MKSTMPAQKDFSNNQSVSMARSVFNRTHTHKTTFDENFLVPFMVDEILPGDSVDLSANIFARMTSTMINPIMDNMFLDIQSFFVPFRLLWVSTGPGTGSWEKFMGERVNPGDDIDFSIPQVTYDGVADNVQQLADYFGVITNVPFSMTALFHRAYTKIYNDWYRDENFNATVTEYTDDGPQITTDFLLQSRGKRHDYFTSCLPSPQKGDEVTINLTGTAPVIGDGQAVTFQNGTNGGELWLDASAGPGLNIDYGSTGHIPGDAVASPTAGTTAVYYGLAELADRSGMIADLTGVSAISINDFRLAVATQQLLELDNRGGTRYFEILKAHFGVTSPDSRLNRSEFLQGSTQMININPVTQTSQSDSAEALYQGNQSAYVTANGRASYSKSFVEHGCVMSILSVRADLTYQQGINRMFSRLTRYDFYFPTFANLGEQAVLNKEIFLQNTSADDDVFGYNEHWSDYRYKPSIISGRFRSDAPSSLDSWHLAQDFASLPVLNATFITENMPIDRVLQFDSTPPVPAFIMDSHIKIRHTRVMPTYSTPGLHRL